MNLSDLQNKDIINVLDGKKIGNIIDARFNPEYSSTLANDSTLECYKNDFGVNCEVGDIMLSADVDGDNLISLQVESVECSFSSNSESFSCFN